MIQSNLGNLFAERGFIDEAIASHRRALDADPRFATARNNIGSALRPMPWRYAEAQEAFAHALDLDPARQESWDNRLFFRQLQSEATPLLILRESLLAAEQLTLSIEQRPRPAPRALRAVLPHLAAHDVEIYA